jgi:PAS domain S-box-containing protein
VAETGEPGHYIDYSSFTGRWINIYAYTARKGQIAFLLRDITERKRTEEALLQSQQKLAEILENIDGGFVTYDTEWRFTNINTRAAQNVGYEPSDLIGKIIWEVFPKTIGTPMEAFFRKAMTERVPVHFEEHGTLTERWYLYDIYPTREGIVNIWYDITERKQTEEALREKQEEQTSLNEELQAQQEELYINYQELQSKSEKIREYADAATQVGQEAEQRAAELDATISSIAIGVVIFDFSGNIIRKNEYAQKLFLLSREDHNLGYHERREILKLHKPDGASYKSEESLLYRALQGEVILNEEVMIGVPEKPVWLSSTFKPIYSNKGNLTGVILTFNDITEQKRKVESLLASERELLRVTLDSLNEAVVAADTAERIIFINQAAAKLTGYSQEEVIGEPISKILYLLDDYTSEPLNHLTAQETPYQPVLVTRDLQEVVISMNSAPIKTTDGQIVGTVIILQDITDKQKTEQELLKAAKLDSLGILAGGVAHDFNNILAGILANLQLAALKQKKREDISKYLENTIEISRKASNLTKQLLTFAKGGDPVKKATAIVKLVKETVQFALSGSKVKAQYQLPEDLWVVDIDEGQISQVINNLAINADQAMPIGGILEIHGENVILETAGQHNPICQVEGERSWYRNSHRNHQ